MDFTLISVQLRNGEEVPADDILQAAENGRISTKVERAILRHTRRDGSVEQFRTFAKAWAVWTGEAWVCVRIGVGANGDTVMWKHPQHNRLTARRY